MLMDKDDLTLHGIVGCRANLAVKLMGRCYDIFMIILICYYALCMVAYLIVEDMIIDAVSNDTTLETFEAD